MRQRSRVAIVLVLAALLFSAGRAGADPGGPRSPAAALGTSITYQGQLKNGSSLVNGNCDFQFSLWDSAGSGTPPTGGTQIGGTQSLLSVPVANGLFTVALDFGAGVFTGDARWVQIAVVCPAGGGSYTTLSPRQPLTAAPFALALPGLYTVQNGGGVPNVVGGYSGNTVGANVSGATIAGGGTNGAFNRVTDDDGTVGGGTSNTAGNANGSHTDAELATVGGGDSNTASGDRSVVGGGGANLASGFAATVPGGFNNTAHGANSFAAGTNARADHTGAFVWNCDGCPATYSAGADEFIVNAAGGIYLGDGTTSGPASSFSSVISTSVGAKLTTGGVWTDNSDRNTKTDFAPVDGLKVLDTLMAMPVQTWRYKVEDPGTRHMGPTAQDFFAAFSVGNDNTHIAALDTNGVALAALQGLDQVVQDQKTQIEALRAQTAAQQKANADLQTRVAALEHTSASPAAAASPSPFNLGWFLFGALLLLNLGGLLGYLLARRASPTRSQS